MATKSCCAECGEEGGASLKTCKSCKLVKYCNAMCQRNHWPKHKKECKQRAAELRDEALFTDPPDKEDCPICFLPMPVRILSCISLPPATASSVPIYDYAEVSGRLASIATEKYYSCCGKSICVGCMDSFFDSGNIETCPFCNAVLVLPHDERVGQIMKRVEANDAGAMCQLGCYYYHGNGGLLQDRTKALELWTQAAALGSRDAHNNLGVEYDVRGDLKRAKFHYEAAAMAGHEVARHTLACIESDSGNMGRAVKHWIIAASAGSYHAMHDLITCFEEGIVTRETIYTTLAAYNNSCAEMRSEARDNYIRVMAETG
jgi:hypothetical protein